MTGKQMRTAATAVVDLACIAEERYDADDMTDLQFDEAKAALSEVVAALGLGVNLEDYI